MQKKDRFTGLSKVTKAGSHWLISHLIACRLPNIFVIGLLEKRYKHPLAEPSP